MHCPELMNCPVISLGSSPKTTPIIVIISPNKLDLTAC